MQDESQRKMDLEEMKEYNEWFDEIAEFAMIQFDRAKMQRLSWRDFRNLARYDLTVQSIMNQIKPQKEEFECFKYALAIQRKNEKKKSKKDKRAKKSPKSQTNKT